MRAGQQAIILTNLMLALNVFQDVIHVLMQKPSMWVCTEWTYWHLWRWYCLIRSLHLSVVWIHSPFPKTVSNFLPSILSLCPESVSLSQSLFWLLLGHPVSQRKVIVVHCEAHLIVVRLIFIKIQSDQSICGMSALLARSFFFKIETL